MPTFPRFEPWRIMARSRKVGPPTPHGFRRNAGTAGPGPCKARVGGRRSTGREDFGDDERFQRLGLAADRDAVRVGGGRRDDRWRVAGAVPAPAGTKGRRPPSRPWWRGTGRWSWASAGGVLRDPHDAEDAFQATFLILVRRARSVRVDDSLGRWLYGVSRKVAARARAVATRRPRHESGAPGVDRGRVDRPRPVRGPVDAG